MASDALESPALDSKDKDELLVIARALGIAVDGRSSKATLIGKILETTGGPTTGGAATIGGATTSPAAVTETVEEAPPAEPSADASTPPAREVILGPDGEPLADWEVDLIRSGDMEVPVADDEADGEGDDDDTAGGEGGKRRRRRRRKKNGQGEGDSNGAPSPTPQGQGVSSSAPAGEPRAAREQETGHGEPFSVAGHLDMRDEGYGFLRVSGLLSHRDDVYVSVRITRQLGLRRGDWVEGVARPAGRNEKNAALVEVTAVNGADPSEARGRRRFDDLTPVFPTEQIRLGDSGDVAGRVVDLVAPIGKGQRALLVSPARAGKTTMIGALVRALRTADPALVVMVVLVDERPEEVTALARAVPAEVLASTFDRSPEEHVQLAELAVEKAKRLVEAGSDVVVVLDGITRLTRACNITATPTGRVLGGGLDAAALHPPKRVLGAARAFEEGGSLTIVATLASSPTSSAAGAPSRMDDAVLEEFRDLANTEIWLDRGAAERELFPAVDVAASGTRHTDALLGDDGQRRVQALRDALLSSPEGALESLLARIAATRSNDDLLAQIGRPAGR